MKSVLFLAWSVYMAFVFLGCSYDLSLEGKACDTSHPCPSGYTCVAQPGHCIRDDNDGGTDCVTGEVMCLVDGVKRQVCEDGHWVEYDCSPDFCVQGECKTISCVSNEDCGDGQWCGPDDTCIPKGNCNDPGVKRCDPSLKSIVVCDEESGNMVLVSDCGMKEEYCDPFAVACLPYCSSDDDCAMLEYSSCEPVSRKCLSMGVCLEQSSCSPSGQCIGTPGACVETPSEIATIAGGGEIDLQCYIGEPSTPPSEPNTCRMQGSIVNFLNADPIPSGVNMLLNLYLLEDIQKGLNVEPITSTSSLDDDNISVYSFEEVPTNEMLVLEVEGTADGEYSTLYTFSIYIRADDCVAGGNVVDFAAPALYSVNYEGYANALSVEAKQDKGLVFGQVRDCNGHKILGATGGLSISNELLYYLRGYIPDDTMAATGSSGFFIATNIVPIQGIASALVSIDGALISLWSRPVRVFPGAASLVLFDKPKAPR